VCAVTVAIAMESSDSLAPVALCELACLHVKWILIWILIQVSGYESNGTILAPLYVFRSAWDQGRGAYVFEIA
jgi:hypothetical protein